MLKITEKIRPNANTICSKVEYSSKSLAKKALKRVRKDKDHSNKDTLDFYYCWKCNNYHIGHQK